MRIAIVHESSAGDTLVRMDHLFEIPAFSFAVTSSLFLPSERVAIQRVVALRASIGRGTRAVSDPLLEGATTVFAVTARAGAGSRLPLPRRSLRGIGRYIPVSPVFTFSRIGSLLANRGRCIRTIIIRKGSSVEHDGNK